MNIDMRSVTRYIFNMKKIEHPGTYIRREVLPGKLSVTKAAAQLGVSRPTLSNLLNGNAALSPEMALRLEKAFGAKKEDLLQMQAAYDDAKLRKESREIPVRPYVASFLAITAAQIATWAGLETSRALLPVFLRRLVLATSTALEKVDFPGFDNAQRHGWDGQVQSASANPWVPLGFSGWEFGCDQDPKRKAQGDYDARTKNVPIAERREITFIFVTPKNWPGKDAWAKEKQAEGQWKDVRAYDASDLEQWLEQSISVQSWMSEKLGTASTDILSLEQCWNLWARATKPELSKALFGDAIEAHTDRLSKWLAAPPADPLIVTAESLDEALAFLACALEKLSSAQTPSYERALVLKSGQALQKAAGASQDFLAIIASADAQALSAGLHKSQHTIIITHRGAVEDANISLDLTEDKTFESGLQEMGFEHQDVADLARESGHSLTILRRRLAQIPAIKSPPWAQDSAVGRRLIPLMLAGVWNSQRDADKEVLSFLTGSPYPEVEITVAELLRSEQSPLWAVGKYRGVASKIDALYATHHLITESDFSGFLAKARVVLSEADPALELPEDQRWMAAVHNKTRNHSSVLRRSICDTLILLAVHGNNLLKKRLGVDIEVRVGQVIREVLNPLDASVLASQRDDLPSYAEAAPDMFLDLLDADLKNNNPLVLTLMQPADTGLLGGGCPRTGLLWALEGLAWNPARLVRVALILARLSEKQIDDNWANKPEASLKAILRSWMPQTAADMSQRCAVLETITKRHPNVGWRLCMSELDSHDRVGTYTHRPHWRKDAVGFGQPLKTRDEIMPFRIRALDLAINWPKHTAQTLGDLVGCLHSLPDDRQQAIWDAVLKWITAGQTDEDKAYLKEQIRRFAFTRRAKSRKLSGAILDAARKALSLLEPADPVVRHAWLFEKQWVEESLEEAEDDKFDHRRHQEKIGNARRNALSEIWPTVGYEGIKRLCQLGEASLIVGWLLAEGILPATDAEAFTGQLVSEPNSAAWVDRCLSGFLGRHDPALRETLLLNLERRFLDDELDGADKLIRLVKAAPFIKSTWENVERLPKEIRLRYWQEVYPQWQHQSATELRELIERLLDVGRPRAAFHAVHFVTDELDSDILVRLLKEVATNDSEPVDQHHFRDYEIEEALKVLDQRTDVAKADMVTLEFAYLAILDRGKRGIPNLERELANSPALFVQLLALAFKRRDGGIDPPEWQSEGETKSARAAQAYRLLHAATRLPGAGDDGNIDSAELKNWIVEARTLCKTYGREEIGDQLIGDLLASSPPGSDGIWPHETVRDVLEEVGTTNIARGMSIAKYNARGAHFRARGGGEERELADQYRNWSKQIAFDWPFTARMLEELAKSYDHEAEWHDEDDSLERRVRR